MTLPVWAVHRDQRALCSCKLETWNVFAVLQRFEKDLAAAEGVGAVSVEAKPRMQGNTMNMILAIGKKE